jgi:hypothetical protein
VADPAVKKHDKLEVKSARLAKDRKTVLLELSDFKPANQIKVKVNLRAADGTTITEDIYATVHRLRAASVASVN